MQYVTKKMYGNSLRPIIELDVFPGCLAMIDTGAEVPVWVQKEEQLATLESVSATGIRSSIGGFGGASEGNLYRITLNIGQLHYHEIPIIACPLKNTTYHIIIPATMFDDMKYSIDNVRKEVVFEVEDDQLVGHLKLQGKGGNLHIFSQKAPHKQTA